MSYVIESVTTLTGQKYLNNNNLYSYIQASRGIRISVDASTWMLTKTIYSVI